MAVPQAQPREPQLRCDLTELESERVVVLHDRWMPAGRGSIDHLVVAPAGVFVIDVRDDGGTLERRNLGDVARSELRLYVGGSDRSTLLHGVEDQMDVVREALVSTGFDVSVRGVLCFTAADWGRLASPFKLGDVLVTYPTFLRGLLGKDAEVETNAIQNAARVLARALPAA